MRLSVLRGDYLTVVLLIMLSLSGVPAKQESTKPHLDPERRVNVPHLGPSSPDPSFTPAIFWFGEVTLDNNYVDVRAWYYDEYLTVMFNIIDRRVWLDPLPSSTTLTEWDSVALYFDLDGDIDEGLDANSYQLVAQLGASDSSDERLAGYRGDGSDWQATPLSFTADSIWRGNYFNDDIDDKGWQVTFVIPFESLGLSGPPDVGTVWGLAAVLHDRDDEAGSPIPVQMWPESMETKVPATWGQLHFGRAGYSAPPAASTETITIRHGLRGQMVPDAHVGGHTVCGDGLDHWTEWGEANYAGYEQINIQNQWDISDYPCFSKYYVTFPLGLVRNDRVVLSATLTMSLFGGAGGGVWGEPPDSYIHVLTVAEDWDENTINWNNAPLAVENISGTWVKPIWLSDSPKYEWDVSKAVADAIESGEPLRLALYSIDGERHSGKYFWSSDSGDWNGEGRPTLRVSLGDPAGTEKTFDHSFYLPLSIR